MLKRRKGNLLNSFKIFEADQFSKDLEHEFGNQREKIEEKLLSYVYPQLRQQPYFGKNIKKLKGYKPETWRYRIRGYRFFYTIDDRKKIVFMTTADNRTDAY
jgi:mRNA interferase RelE/StbE